MFFTRRYSISREEGEMKKQGDLEILKIQLSVASSEPYREVLLHNKDRTFEHIEPASAMMLALMGNRVKAFYYGRVVKGNKIDLVEEAPWQDW